MYISKECIVSGYNEFINIDSPEGKLAMMDVGLIVLNPGEKITFDEEDKEVAILLLEGKVNFIYLNQCIEANRENPFDCLPWCLHTSKGINSEIIAIEHSELYVQKTVNQNSFETKLYTPQQIQIQKLGDKGELQGKMRRNIRTVFDYENAPYSNMVLGEVVNFPGLWSSYPPHHHPQPEVYFYRYDKPQGFGAGFTNGKVYETHHNGLLLITDKFHSQTAAPGYVLCYVWGIRHIDGNPWRKTRIDDLEHTWMLEPNANIWCEKEEKKGEVDS